MIALNFLSICMNCQESAPPLKHALYSKGAPSLARIEEVYRTGLYTHISLRYFGTPVIDKVNKLYLVLEYCKKGDLMNILNGDTRTVTCDPMNDTDVWYIMRQVCSC